MAWCSRCELGFVHPLPTDDRLASFYGTTYFDTYGSRSYTSELSRVAALQWKILTHLAWRLDPQPDSFDYILEAIPKQASVLDIGCGNGTLLRALRDAGHSVAGVEPDAAARANARKEGLEVFAGSAESMPDALQGRKFDVVLMTHVLEHCRDPRRAIAEARKLVEPGGQLLIEVPNARSLAARHAGPAWFHGDAGRHLFYFTPNSVSSLLEQHGCCVYRTVYREYTVQFTAERLAAEQQVWDELHRDGARVAGSCPPRPSVAGRWGLFLKTLLASKDQKYGIVSIVAHAH